MVRRCSANIPDAPPPQKPPIPVEAPKLELEEKDPKKAGKRKKRLGKQALRITGLTIGGGAGPAGSGLRAP